MQKESLKSKLQKMKKEVHQLKDKKLSMCMEVY